jgi:hypothetical protein
MFLASVYSNAGRGCTSTRKGGRKGQHTPRAQQLFSLPESSAAFLVNFGWLWNLWLKRRRCATPTIWHPENGRPGHCPKDGGLISPSLARRPTTQTRTAASSPPYQLRLLFHVTPRTAGPHKPTLAVGHCAKPDSTLQSTPRESASAAQLHPRACTQSGPAHRLGIHHPV